MNLADYFEKVKGTGVLGTADSEGKVDLAIYARPGPWEAGLDRGSGLRASLGTGADGR